MQHLENIKALFSRNFVESPVLDTFEAGNIVLPTGQLIACDPVITSDMKAFETRFPKGKFPAYIHKEKETGCIAYVELVFGGAPVTTWKLATTEGQNMQDLAEGEIFGYPVESGMGCFMDLETQNHLNRLEQKLYHLKGDDFKGIYEEFFHGHFFDEKGATDQFALMKPDEENAGNILAFETGYGEGFYASYIGFSAENIPVKIVSEFIEIS